MSLEQLYRVYEWMKEELDEPDENTCNVCFGFGCEPCDNEGNFRGRKRTMRARLYAWRSNIDRREAAPGLAGIVSRYW